MWIVAYFSYFKIRHRWCDIGGICILSYLLYAVLSYIVYVRKLEGNSLGEITLFPFIYLFLSYLLMLYPLLKFDVKKIKYLALMPQKHFELLSYFIIVLSILHIPMVYQKASSGLLLLLLDSSYGEEMYQEMAMSYSDSGYGGINIIPLLVNAFSVVSIFLLVYSFILEKTKKIISIGLVFSFVMVAIEGIVSGSRTWPILSLITFFTFYIVLKQWIPLNRRKLINRTAIVIVSFLFLFIGALTLSRFADKGVRDDGAFDSIISYGGMAPLYFNSYCIDANGTRNGDKILVLLKKFVGYDTPNNFVELREKYYYMRLDDSKFSSFVGDFVLDFGPILAFMFIISMSVFFTTHTRIKSCILYPRQLLLIYLLLCICIQGGMYLWPFGDIGGNLKLSALIFVYIYLFIFCNGKNYSYLSSSIPSNTRK